MTDRIIVTDVDEVWDSTGALVAAETVKRDVTAHVVEWALHQQLRDDLNEPRARVAADRIAALEARVDQLTRLVIGRDLLDG